MIDDDLTINERAYVDKHRVMVYKAEAFLVDYVRQGQERAYVVVKQAEAHGVNYSALCLAAEKLARSIENDGSRYGSIELRKSAVRKWLKAHPEFDYTVCDELPPVCIIRASVVVEMPGDPGIVPRVEQLVRLTRRKGKR